MELFQNLHEYSLSLGFMVFNATFNNISVNSITWWQVLLVEETGENHASH
jgi:hypothetical protein